MYSVFSDILCLSIECDQERIRTLIVKGLILLVSSAHADIGGEYLKTF